LLELGDRGVGFAQVRLGLRELRREVLHGSGGRSQLLAEVGGLRFGLLGPLQELLASTAATSGLLELALELPALIPDDQFVVSVADGGRLDRRPVWGPPAVEAPAGFHSQPVLSCSSRQHVAPQRVTAWP